MWWWVISQNKDLLYERTVNDTRPSKNSDDSVNYGYYAKSTK